MEPNQALAGRVALPVPQSSRSKERSRPALAQAAPHRLGRCTAGCRPGAFQRTPALQRLLARATEHVVNVVHADDFTSSSRAALQRIEPNEDSENLVEWRFENGLELLEPEIYFSKVAACSSVKRLLRSKSSFTRSRIAAGSFGG